MISAMMTVLGILLGIVLFCVILGVGLVEIIKALVKVFVRKDDAK